MFNQCKHLVIHVMLMLYPIVLDLTWKYFWIFPNAKEMCLYILIRDNFNLPEASFKLDR